MKFTKLFLIPILFFFIFTNIFAQNAQKPYVLLVSLDGFRWDYTQRGLTSILDSLQKEGVHPLSLKPCYPSKTFPNHLSIITGMYPQNHGVIDNFFIDKVTQAKYKLSDSNAVREPRWYQGEAFWETAERQGITCASYFWPGSEVLLQYRRPTYFEKYNQQASHKTRIDGVINWLQLPQEKRPHFITLYFEDIDEAGHEYGPNAPELNTELGKINKALQYLAEEIKRIGFNDSLNIVIVSDHGMGEVSSERRVDVEKIILDAGQPTKGIDFEAGGTYMMLFVENKALLESTYSTLQKNANHFKVYKRTEVPENYHFNRSQYEGDLIIIPDPLWNLVVGSKMRKEYSLHGNHGWDNSFSDMHGIFYASGPFFKKNYLTGTINNIDIYPLLCRIFNIIPRSNIDGKIENIEFLLK